MTDQRDATDLPPRRAMKWNAETERRVVAASLALAAVVSACSLVVIALRLGEIEHHAAYMPVGDEVNNVADSVSAVSETLKKIEADRAPPPVRSSVTSLFARPPEDPVAAAIDRQTRAQEREAAAQARRELFSPR